MIKNNLLNKWLFYPWQRDNNSDNLIHKDDLLKITALGVVECIHEDSDFLTIRNKEGNFKVRIDGVITTLPKPKFIWGESICVFDRPDSNGIIDDLFWHHNKEQYFYLIRIDGKRKSKRFSENDLVKFSNK